MVHKTLLKGYIFIAVVAVACIGCHDKSSQTITSHSTPVNPAMTNADDSGGYASDISRLEVNNDDIISIANAAANTGSVYLRSTQTTLSGCATVATDTVDNPHIIVVRFGVTDCLCQDSKNRRGSIIITFNGKYNDSGSAHTITYDNYFVNDIQVTGSKTVTYMGTNATGQPYYNVAVNDSMISMGDSTISWTGNRVRTWIAGYSTAARNDDVFITTGTNTLTRANGHIFSFVITTPLRVAIACPFIESGVATITSSTFTNGARTLDFGMGTCDNLAQVTIDTTTYSVFLR